MLSGQFHAVASCAGAGRSPFLHCVAILCAFLAVAGAGEARADMPDAGQRAALEAVAAARKAQTGFAYGMGLIDAAGMTHFYDNGIGPTDLVRIGSQSKTFAGTVVLRLVESGAFSLDDTLGEVVARHGVDLGAALPAGADSITIAQLLNMSSGIPNYLGQPVTVAGTTKTLWEQWKDQNYGPVPGIDHKALAALGLGGYPAAFAPGFTGAYSNTNAIILSLIAEKVTGKPFETLIDELTTGVGLTGTRLPTESSPAGLLPGMESGSAITNMDATIPWTSGSIVSTVEDQLYWLRALTQNKTKSDGELLTPEMFAKRFDLANSSTFIMGGLPVQYGYNVLTIDMNPFGVPLTLVGHGGSIAGYSSFSAWCEELNFGIVTNAAVGSGIDTFGNYTNIASETLLMNAMKALERTNRGDHLAGVSPGTLSYGAAGGYYFTSGQTLTGDTTIAASGAQTVFLDLENPATILMTIDPTLTGYLSGNSTTPKTHIATGSNTLTLAPGARVEGYGAYATLVDVNAAGGKLVNNGELAFYGPNSTAVSLDAASTYESADNSLIYVQGGGGVALDLDGYISPTAIQGAIQTLGNSTAVAATNGANAQFENATVDVYATGLAMDSSFKTTDPDKYRHTAVQAQSGSTLDFRSSSILIDAERPWDGVAYPVGVPVLDFPAMPGVLTTAVRMDSSTVSAEDTFIAGPGYGVVLEGSGLNRFTLTGSGSLLRGGLAAFKQTGGTTDITVSGGATVVGRWNLLGTGNSLTLGDARLLVALDENAPAAHIANAGAVTLGAGTRTTVLPVSSGLLADDSFLLMSGVTSFTGDADQIVVQDVGGMYRPITFSTAYADASDSVTLTAARDWSYYRNSGIENGSLAGLLDHLPSVQSSLSPSVRQLVQYMDSSAAPRSDAGRLQPHTLHGIALSELRHAGNTRRFAAEPVSRPGDAATAQDQTQAQAQAQVQAWHAFGGVFGNHARQDASGEDPFGYTIDGQGALVGMGKRLGDDVSLGAFLGYSSQEQEYKKGYGRIRDTITRVGPFADIRTPLVDVFASTSGGFHEVDSRRELRFSSWSETNDADYRAWDVLSYLSLSKDVDVSVLRVTPRVEAAHVYLRADSYTEKTGAKDPWMFGQDASGVLDVDDATYQYLASNTSLEVGYDITGALGVVSLSAGAGWWRQWLGDRPEVDAAFVGGGGDTFATMGARTDDDMLLLKAGTSWDTKSKTNSDVRLALNFEQYIGETARDISVASFTLGVAF